MKSLFLIGFIVAFVFSVPVFAQSNDINVVPIPKRVERRDGQFVIDKKTVLVARTEMEERMARSLRSYLRETVGIEPKIVEASKKGTNAIYLNHLTGDHALLAGEYRIEAKPTSVELASPDETPLFYGLQTLMQLIRKDEKGVVSIPAVGITDSPRFAYRGMHLDVSRHFMPVEFVKKYIDLMSQYKFNYFHWHLTDDQGWRIEIKKYPKLTEIGSKRSESQVGRFSTEFKGDGVPVEGFYTQEQIKDVVAYARARYITVVPEIELPGHASAALAAYPQFGCKADYKYEVKKTWGIFKEVYCPTEETFKFLGDIIDETIALFPDSPYVHIGGDEVLKDHWKESPFVQELKTKENLKDEHEVQSYFVRRMEQHVNSKGKKIIGWDEILEGGLAPNATVMSWRGMKGGIEAAKAKHDVIMTPTDYAYLDYSQGDPATEPLNIGGWLPLEKVYQFDPVPKELSADEAKFIIGGQGNIWTEYLKKPENVEYMAFPRMLAIAESVWSRAEDKNYDDFLRRLPSQLARLDKQNVNYRIPAPRNLQNIVLRDNEAFRIENIVSDIPGARVLYTFDGSEPNERSPEISPKFMVNPTGNAVQTLKTIVVLPNGRKSSVYTATILRQLSRGPEPDVKEKRPGATYGFVVPPAADSIEPMITSGETRSTALQQFAKTADLKQNFGVTFDGYMNVPVDAIYEFEVVSTWDTTILVDGQKLIDGVGTADRKTRTQVVPLRAGLHKVSLRYNHRGGDPFWRVRWAIKGQNWRNLGGGDLVH